MTRLTSIMYTIVETTTIHEGFASEVGFSQGPEQYCQEDVVSWNNMLIKLSLAKEC